MAQFRQVVLLGSTILLAFLALAALVRAIRGPRFTDRVIAVNMINTMVVAMICILSVFLKEDFLVDVALIYALLSFLTVIVLAQLIIIRRRRKNLQKKEQIKKEAARG